ncbi:MAG: galactose-1-phosphate uridylyltransferase [Thermoanaerobaculia bacterium]
MSRLVFHPLTFEPILLAPGRSERPGAWGTSGTASDSDTELCPFCPGNEEETPPELTRHGAGTAWRTRVVPNKYPAIPPIDGVPSHEVLIDAAEHDSPLESRSLDGWVEMIELWRECVDRHASRAGVESVLLFRNEGRAAGQSIAHPHSQLLALPFVSPRLESELMAFADGEPCPLCSATQSSRGDAARLLIGERDGIVILCPAAPRFPYETWIVPARHECDWRAGNSLAIATAAREAIRALRWRWPASPFNLALATAPAREVARGGYHWHLEILPRLTNLAGFELATGSWMNIVEPERAAAELRAALSS